MFNNRSILITSGAGMAIENIPSLKYFLSCGLRKVYEDEENCRVLLNYSELIKPDFITDEAICEVAQRARTELVNRLT